MGDFNETMWSFEHFSARQRPEPQTRDFRDVLSQCDLHDIGFVGLPWTYDNKQKGDRNVRVRLDRAVASPSWSDHFSGAKLTHLVSSRSDHCPILLRVEREKYRPVKCFRYEIMWEREDSLGEAIKLAWEQEGTALNLGEWSVRVFGSVSQEIKEIKAKVEELSSLDPINHDGEIRKLYARLDELLYREEMMWLQRSRVSWLKEGDRNTKFFHRQAAWRAKKNKINCLKDEDSRYVENKGDMEKLTRDFFQKLYARDEGVDPGELVDLFDVRVDASMNLELCKPFSDEEISDALFQIGPLKAPGPVVFRLDSFNAIGEF